MAPRRHKLDKKFHEFNLSDVPDSVDWNAKGGVNPAGDQMLCEANWAMNAVGAIEGSHFAQTGKLL